MTRVARYDLVGDELEAQRRALVDEIVSVAPSGEAAVGWIPPDHPGADVVRAEEARVFPDIVGFMSDEIEARCRFLVVIDLASETGLTHAFRVSSLRYRDGARPGDRTDSATIGIPMVDEVIEANPPLTAAEVEDFYRTRGIGLELCIAVETNLRVTPQGSAPSGMRWSDYGYIALFQEARERPDVIDGRGVFAHLNEAARRSLDAVGAEAEPFLGRPDLRSPAAQEGTFDDCYSPSFLPPTEVNLRVFGQLAEVGAPEVRLG